MEKLLGLVVSLYNSLSFEIYLGKGLELIVGIL